MNTQQYKPGSPDEQKQPDIPPEVSAAFSDHPFVAEIYWQRYAANGIDALFGFLDPNCYQPASPFDFPDMQRSVNLILSAIQTKKHIGVWGDFDVDGMTATALLVDCLRFSGAQVSYHIPVRGPESHGVSLEYLKSFLNEGVQLLITCDTGIDSHEALAFAARQGVQIILSDHHTLPEILPQADTILHPQLLPADHPCQALCGVGVAWELCHALMITSEQADKTKDWYWLAALGTVADVASLVKDNRYLVQQGIRSLRQNPPLLIKKIFEYNESDPSMLTEENIGFLIAPRLNAIGRLGDSNPVVEALLSEDPFICSQMANTLERYNADRRLKTEQTLAAAMNQITTDTSFAQQPAAIVAHVGWPAGVAGIVASKLTEIFQKPALVISLDEKGTAKGSARSINGVNITRAITEQAEYLNAAGGHPMAAGFSLPAENLARFSAGIQAAVKEQLRLLPTEQKTPIDAIVSLAQADENLCLAVEKLAPFGPGNPQPVFSTPDLLVKNAFFLKKNKEYCKYLLEDSTNNLIEVIDWNGVFPLEINSRVDLLYRLRMNHYKNQFRKRAELVQAILREDSQQGFPGAPRSLSVRDFRLDTRKGLHWLQEHPEKTGMIWSEGRSRETLNGLTRTELSINPTLIMAATPPDLRTFNQVLETVQPNEIILFAIPAQPETIKEFLQQIILTVQQTLKSGKNSIRVEQLHAISAQHEFFLDLGIQFINCLGKVTLRLEPGGSCQISSPSLPDPSKARQIQEKMEALHKEQRAFIQFYKNADSSMLTGNDFNR